MTCTRKQWLRSDGFCAGVCGDVVAQLGEFDQEPVSSVFGVDALGEVLRPQVLVWDVVGEHVPGGDEDGVPPATSARFLPPVRDQAPVLRVESRCSACVEPPIDPPRCRAFGGWLPERKPRW